ncbi:rab family gtpase [Vairimorpha apis BRL 01]|uniref:Rab family gtpase n=1 Tax=Vairimorpha apis BRL 01 TaxID=1037528 RepID=T0LAX4_9MICR|nr:rab family gtpase [Vairimorpha apis BRL 01]
MRKPDHRFKIIILGESNVGKTSIIRKYKTDEFQDSIMSTIGIDTVTKMININNQSVLLNIWDTAGQERFFSITKSYYRNADAILLVFDLSVENTFNTVDRWYNNIKNETENVPLFLIGNKKDLVSDTIEKNMKFYYTSAKFGLNVEKIFEDMAKTLLKNDKHRKLTKSKNKISLPKISKRSCC